jgi:uncharacterized protein YjdB
MIMTALANVDLSSDARDFQRVALEPGLPMLDANSNACAVLQRWLGDLAAEAEWLGDHAEFFAIREGRRQLDVTAEVVTEKDLRGPLHEQFQQLGKTIASIEPQSETERLVAAQLDADRARQNGQLLKYRGPGGDWRLVYCWGFSRKDAEPATPILCRKCLSGPWLYLDRAASPSACPGCTSDADSAQEVSRGSGVGLFAGSVLVFALLAGLGYWWSRQSRPEEQVVLLAGVESVEVETQASTNPAMTVSPDAWITPVGGLTEFQALVSGDDPSEASDVSRLIYVTSADPRICRYDDTRHAAIANSTGTTTLKFQYGDLTKTVNVRVDPAEMPRSLELRPTSDSIFVGQTQRLSVVGIYPGEREVDLTNSATWESSNSRQLFCYDGLIEGISPGQARVMASYSTDPEGEPVVVEQEVVIEPANYQSLQVRIEPASIEIGSSARLVAEATTDQGSSVSVIEGSALTLAVDPPRVAKVDGDRLFGLVAGAGTISMTFGDLTADASFEVVEGNASPDRNFPKRLEMLVGEMMDLRQHFSGNGDLQRETSLEISYLHSDDPLIVEVGGDRLMARSVGTTTIRWTEDGDESTAERELVIDVREEPFTSIAIDPTNLLVPVHSSMPFRVVGITEAGRRATLAPDLLNWERVPDPNFIHFDPRMLVVEASRVTGDETLPMLCRFRDLDAAGYVKVTDRPFKLAIEPGGEVEVPVGQRINLRVLAEYSPTQRHELTADEVEWNVSDVDGIQFEAGVVTATSAPVGPVEAVANYRGESAEVSLRSTDSTAGAVELLAGKEVILPGDEGAFTLKSIGPARAELATDLARFDSSEEDVLAVADGGKWKAMKPGRSTITVDHPSLGEPQRKELIVGLPEATGLMFEPDQIVVGVGQAAKFELFIIASSDADSEPVALPIEHLNAVQFATETAEAAELKQPWVIGRTEAQPFEITAEYEGMTASLIVEVRPVPNGTPIRLRPDAVSLSAGARFFPNLEQRLPGLSEEETVDQTMHWRRVDSRRATWSGDKGLLIDRSQASAPVMVHVNEEAAGPLTLKAEYGGSEATMQINTDAAIPAGPDASIVLNRYPEGERLASGQQQHYSFEIVEGGTTRPATQVRWQRPFENEHARFSDGVLTAKRSGHTQELVALVDGNRFAFETEIVDPTSPLSDKLAERNEQPTQLTIQAMSGGSLRVVFGATSRDYRVEAEYLDGQKRDVTDSADLTFEQGSDRCARVDRGGIVGVAPGTTNVYAKFGGLRTDSPMKVDVLASDSVQDLQLLPESSSLKVGETARLRAIAVVGGQSVGEITRLPGLQWKSRSPDVVASSGPTVTAVSPGKGGVTAQLGSLVSSVAEITVAKASNQIARASLQPTRLTMRVGERKELGREVRVIRGELQLDEIANAKVDNESVVKLDGRWLIAVAPGNATLNVAAQDTSLSLPIRVLAERRTRMTAPRNRIARRGGAAANRSSSNTGSSAKPNDSKSTAAGAAARGHRRIGNASRGSRSTHPAGARRNRQSGNLTPNAGRSDNVRQPAEDKERGAGNGSSPETVYDFAGHEAAGIEPRLVIEPPGGVIMAGSIDRIRVIEVDNAGRRRERTSDARIRSSDAGVIRTQRDMIAGIAPGRAQLTASLPDSDLTASAEFRVADVTAEGISVSPAHLFLNVGEQASLSVKVADETLSDRNRLKFRIASGSEVISVSDRGVVTAHKPGAAAIDISWDGGEEKTVPVSVRQVGIFEPMLADADPGAPVDGESSMDIAITDVRDDERYSMAKIRVSVPADLGEIEFRVADSDGSEDPASPWVRGTNSGGRLVATLSSPPLVRRSGRLHRVVIEARRAGDGSINRYAYRFQLETRATEEASAIPE